jgi:hypothetical protein
VASLCWFLTASLFVCLLMFASVADEAAAVPPAGTVAVADDDTMEKAVKEAAMRAAKAMTEDSAAAAAATAAAETAADATDSSAPAADPEPNVHANGKPNFGKMMREKRETISKVCLVFARLLGRCAQVAARTAAQQSSPAAR